MNIKGFNQKLQCRGYQFEIGKEYKIDSKNLTSSDLCSNKVFHYCKSLANVHEYYDCNNNDNRFCEIEVLGEEITDGKKYGSNRIKIVREIIGDELDCLIGKVNGNSGLFNSGDYNSGDYNSGYYNSGYYNSGYRNSGYRNSGNRNSGYKNSGDYNSGNYSNGFFNSIDDNDVMIFNKRSGMSHKQFAKSIYYNALNSIPFILTEWVEYSEKEESERKALDEGYLKTYSYKNACAKWWKKMTDENKKIIMSIPNFDKDVFKEITGIKLWTIKR